MVERAAVFIDGGYLEKVAEQELGYWIDMAAFSSAVCSRISQDWMDRILLLRTYFYHCLPWQPPHPSEEDRRRVGARRKYFEFLRSLDSFQVREGVLRVRGTDASGQPVLVQKRVDLLLGLDLAAHAIRRDVAHVVLVSGDSDLVPAVQRARDEGLTVWLCHGNSHARDLWQSCDRRIQLTADWVPRRER